MTRRSNGSSLVEVLVALAILVLLIPPLIALRTTSNRQAVFSGLDAQALVWARQVATNLASKSYDDLLLMRGFKTVEGPGLEGPVGFPGSLEIDLKDAEPGAGVPRAVQLGVTVSFSVFGKDATQGRSVVRLDRLIAMPERGVVRLP